MRGSSKVRKMHVEIKVVPEEHMKEETRKWSDAAMKGGFTRNETTVRLTPAMFMRVFSQKRIELLMSLCEKPAGTVSELAKRLDRPFEVVYRDLQLFEEYDIVTLTKMKQGMVSVQLAGDIHMPILRAQPHKKAFKANKGLISSSAAVPAASKAS